MERPKRTAKPSTFLKDYESWQPTSKAAAQNKKFKEESSYSPDHLAKEVTAGKNMFRKSQIPDTLPSIYNVLQIGGIYCQTLRKVESVNIYPTFKDKTWP
jgi:hypothetical protein